VILTYVVKSITLNIISKILVGSRCLLKSKQNKFHK